MAPYIHTPILIHRSISCFFDPLVVAKCISMLSCCNPKFVRDLLMTNLSRSLYFTPQRKQALPFPPQKILKKTCSSSPIMFVFLAYFLHESSGWIKPRISWRKCWPHFIRSQHKWCFAPGVWKKVNPNKMMKEYRTRIIIYQNMEEMLIKEG